MKSNSPTVWGFTACVLLASNAVHAQASPAASASASEAAAPLQTSVDMAAATPEPATPRTDVPTSPPDAPSSLRANEGLVTLDYQVLKVPGDLSIDLMGVHVYKRANSWLYWGGGAYAPLFKGAYGGFMAFDLGVHMRYHLTPRWFVMANLSGGGGGGGRDMAQSKTLSGSGGFYKASIGTGYDFDGFSVGLSLSKMQFQGATIQGTSANAFVSVPYGYLSGPYAAQGRPLSAADAQRAKDSGSESMYTLLLDNYWQQKPQGTFTGTVRVVDLQYSHFFKPNTYGYAALGVGYAGLPLYNQIVGGVGQRWRLSPRVSVYGQLGIGSGGWSPDQFNTGSGLLVYPRVSAEYAVTPQLGLALTAGYLWAPKGSSKNVTYGLALTRHIQPGNGGDNKAFDGPSLFEGYRISMMQQTEFGARYNNINIGRVPLLGVQFDAMLTPHWYIPVQAAVAYGAYYGYPGYGELTGGIGLQSDSNRPLQVFGQLMAGANVHGPGIKANAGVRWNINDEFALHLAAVRVETRKPSTGGRFSANGIQLGIDYRFSLPGH